MTESVIPASLQALYREIGQPVYPAHPLVFLVGTLLLYPDPIEALRTGGPESPWPKMVGDSRLSGDGGGAAEAARLLHALLHDASPGEVIQRADTWFSSSITAQGKTYADRLQPGLRQADAVKDLFRTLSERLAPTVAEANEG